MGMLNFEAETPDGEKFIVTVPDTATRAELQKAVKDQLRAFRFKQQAESAVDPYKRQAEQQGPLDALAIGAGKGFYNVGRGVGKMLGMDVGAEQPEKKAYEALQKSRPIATTVGETVGESAPFLPLGGPISKVASRGGQLALGALAGGVEGGVTAAGRDDSALAGTLLGAGGALGADLIMPFLAKKASVFFRKIAGREPIGALIDSAGNPSDELVEALRSQGLSYDDLLSSTKNELMQLQNTDAQQAARKALFDQEGIPYTQGELTRNPVQVQNEQRLLQNPDISGAGDLRLMKLQQSEQIKGRLKEMLGFDFEAGSKEALENQSIATGEEIIEGLSNRYSLLRTEKNRLYKSIQERLENAKDIPIFTDSLAEAIPNERTIQELMIQDEVGAKSAVNWLKSFGVMPVTAEEIAKGFDVQPLSLKNFDTFRKGLNNIGKSSDAVKVITERAKSALDDEMSNLVNSFKSTGDAVPKDILEDLRVARKIVRTSKTEFSPKVLVGRITGKNIDGSDRLMQASQVYNKLVSKSTPYEGVEQVVKSLQKSFDGDRGLGALQTTTLMDLINAGFSTESKKLMGQRVFNPIAFKNRMEAIGHKKLLTLFKDEKDTLKALRNIEKISKELVPDNSLVPKGSSPMLLSLANSLGLTTIALKVPGGQYLLEPIRAMGRTANAGVAARKALNATPETLKYEDWITRTFPNISRVMSSSIASQQAPSMEVSQ